MYSMRTRSPSPPPPMPSPELRPLSLPPTPSRRPRPGPMGIRPLRARRYSRSDENSLSPSSSASSWSDESEHGSDFGAHDRHSRPPLSPTTTTNGVQRRARVSKHRRALSSGLYRSRSPPPSDRSRSATPPPPVPPLPAYLLRAKAEPVSAPRPPVACWPARITSIPHLQL